MNTGTVRQPSTAHGLSVLVPMFNEATTLPTTYPRLLTVLESTGLDWELVLVDDGSKDDTAAVVRRLSAGNPHVRLLSYPRNCGKGAAVKRGFPLTTKDLVLVIDADLLTSREVIWDYVRRLDESGADLVAANKRHPESRINYTVQRRLLSRGFNWFTRALFGIRLADTQCGFKLYRRRLLEHCIPLVYSDRFAFEVELLAHARRHRFAMTDAPINVEEARPPTRSTVTAIEVLKMAKDLVLIFPRVVIAGGRSLTVIWRERNAKIVALFRVSRHEKAEHAALPGEE